MLMKPKKHGAEKFRELLDNAEPFFPYLLNNIKNKVDIRTPQGKRQLCEKVFPVIGKFQDEIVRGGYINELSAFLEIDSVRIEHELNEYQSRQSRKASPGKPVAEKSAIVKLSKAEVTLLATLFSNKDAAEYACKNIDIEYIEHPVAHQLVKRMYEECRKGTWRGIETFLDDANDEEAKIVTELICKTPEDVENKWRRIIEDCKAALYNKAYSDEIAALRKLISEETGKEKIKELQLQIQSYQREKLRHGRIRKIDIKSTRLRI